MTLGFFLIAKFVNKCIKYCQLYIKTQQSLKKSEKLIIVDDEFYEIKSAEEI